MWTTTFSPLLERLTDKSFDLFITSPNDLKDTEREIILAYPEAYIVKLSNRGRDVLPFTNIAGILHSHGYSYFLKLHSKKSPQRIDGSEWLESMLDKLVPVNAALQEKLTDILRKDTTGLVGPSGHYVSLPVGKQSEIENRPRMNEVMHRTLTDRFELYAKVPWSDLGFFEGTMFWGRFDAIGGLVEANRNPIYYDAEAGQTDGTTAHAMERAFSVYPEIETKHMYEIGPDDVYRIQYRTDQYPDWSEYYKGKRRKVTR